MPRSNRKTSLVSKIALEMIWKSGLQHPDFDNLEVGEVYRMAHVPVWAYIRKMQAPVLGLIIASGKGTRHGGNGDQVQVSFHGTTVQSVLSMPGALPQGADGLTLLRCLARAVIIAKMTDVLAMTNAIRLPLPGYQQNIDTVRTRHHLEDDDY